MSEDDPMGPVLTEEELVARLWRLAPVGSELFAMLLSTWVLAPGAPRGGMVELCAHRRLPGSLHKPRVGGPEGFARELGRLAYDDERAFVPERG